jgi:hypothetical protein
MMAGTAIAITRTPVTIHPPPLCSSNSPTSLLTANLVGYWTLDDNCAGGTPSTAADLSGNGNTGTLVNSPTWQSGSSCEFGGCLNFTNRLANYVDLPASAFSSLRDMTISMWVNIPNYRNWQEFYSHFVDGNNRAILETDASGDVYLNNIVGGSYSCGAYYNPMPLNQWTLLTATYVSSTNTISFYVNGALKQATACGSDYSWNAMGTSVKNYIASQNGDYLNGKIDDSRIYNVALTATQIAQLYQYGVTYQN